jgi:hypothetical protein
MATIINASTSAGLVQTADTSGNLNLQSNGSTIVAVTSTGVAVTGTLSASGGNVGTTTNNNAAVGVIGEYVSSAVGTGSNSLTTATAKNLTTISLTAGDWDVSGCIFLDGAVTTNVTLLRGNASSTSATINFYAIGWAGLSFGSAGVIPNATGSLSVPLPTQRFSLSATTTIYLVGIATFSVSTLTAGGYITARRVR